MFRRLSKLARTYREKILSLVVLPAFFLGTLPHTACICADGHREEFCKAAACRSIASGSSTTACCGCSCCQNRGSDQGRSCCKDKCCERPTGSTAPAGGLTAKTGTCCQPIVEAPAPAATSSKAELGAKADFVAAVVPFPSAILANEIRPVMEPIGYSTPPPLDVVIVFLHLTI